MKEIWKEIPGYEGLYEASNLGRIRNRKGKILKPNSRICCGLERWSAHLCKNGVERSLSWGRCIYSAFNGPIPEGLEVNHIDERPENNNLDNLNLLTRKENLNWGTVKERRGLTNTNGKSSKAVMQYGIDGTFIKEYPSTKEVKRQTGYNCGCISNVCTGKRKTAFGYIWRYKDYD